MGEGGFGGGEGEAGEALWQLSDGGYAWRGGVAWCWRASSGDRCGKVGGNARGGEAVIVTGLGGRTGSGGELLFGLTGE